MRLGGDANLGQKLWLIFHELALTDINMRCAARTIAGPQPYLQMPLQGARALRELILADGSLTEVGLDQLLAAFGEMIADPAVYATWFNVMQVWGRKAKT